jgi:hypothetical protein
MVRALALTGLAASFLGISPHLRTTVWDGIAAATGALDAYSPVSYLALVGVLVLGFLFFVRASSAPH